MTDEDHQRDDRDEGVVNVWIGNPCYDRRKISLLLLLPVLREKAGMRVLWRIVTRRLISITQTLTLPSPGVPGEGSKTIPAAAKCLPDAHTQPGR